MQLGGSSDYTIEFSNGQLVVSVNGNSQSFVFDRSWTGNSVNFKVGNYLQDNGRSGTVWEVVYSSLQDN
jgi:hypothetical protein